MLGGLQRAGSWASRGAMDREQLLMFQLCCEVDTLLHTLGELGEQRSPGNPPHLLPLCNRPQRAPGGVSLPSCPPGPGHRAQELGKGGRNSERMCPGSSGAEQRRTNGLEKQPVPRRFPTLWGFTWPSFW